MTPLVPIVMFGWIPFTMILFSAMPPRRAVVICVVGGFLFLPVAEYDLPGLPMYSKVVAISLSLFLGGLFSGQRRRNPLRLSAHDLPMIAWCFIVPFATSLANGLGVYEGFSIMMENLLTWGILYWTGRRYFSAPEGLRTITKGIIFGGLIYIPLILFELRMSPQLSNIVYGFFPHSFLQHIRYGGWRPIVFTYHGLTLSFFMAAAATCVFWLWRSKAISAVWGVPAGALSFVLAIITVLCKSASGWFYLILGMGSAVLYAKTNSSRLVRIILWAALIYLTVRIMNVLSIDHVRSFAAHIFDEERIDSLYFRLRQEDLFGPMSFQRPLFGWGGYKRGWPFDPVIGRQIEVIDALWTILFNTYGFLGLISVYTAVGSGPWLIGRAFRKPLGIKRIAESYRLDAIVLSLIISFALIDTLFNGGVGELYILCAGALISYCRGTENAESARGARGWRRATIEPGNLSRIVGDERAQTAS